MNKNKLQLLREYFKLCGNIVRMRHEIQSAKNNVVGRLLILRALVSSDDWSTS